MMKTLTFEQMEQVNGGGAWRCLFGVATMVVALAGVATATVVTGGTAAIFAVGWLGGGVEVAVGCSEWALGHDEAECDVLDWAEEDC